jgi:serine/threonine-protein kinase HipA
LLDLQLMYDVSHAAETNQKTADDLRIPYLSAASLLQASHNEERSYFEMADAIRAQGMNPVADVRQLWRRMVFNLLITHVDDHLHNLGFLHVENGLWRLAPAFDINPLRAVLAQVVHATLQWKAVAMSAAVGLTAKEANDFAPAFEYEQITAVRALLR